MGKGAGPYTIPPCNCGGQESSNDSSWTTRKGGPGAKEEVGGGELNNENLKKTFYPMHLKNVHLKSGVWIMKDGRVYDNILTIILINDVYSCSLLLKV